MECRYIFMEKNRCFGIIMASSSTWIDKLNDAKLLLEKTRC